MSKFSRDVLQRCVFPFTVSDDLDVILGATFGEDVSLTRVGDDILVSHLDPIVGAIANIGWLAVHVACNDIATTGIPPRWILPLVMVPRQDDEDLLEQIMRDAGRAAREIGVSIIGGHTGYSVNLARPLVAVTAHGTSNGREPLRNRGAGVGEQVVGDQGHCHRRHCDPSAAWARNKSAPDVSPHIQRLHDIQLERFGPRQRLLVRLNANTTSPHQLKTLTGLSAV